MYVADNESFEGVGRKYMRKVILKICNDLKILLGDMFSVFQLILKK